MCKLLLWSIGILWLVLPGKQLEVLGSISYPQPMLCEYYDHTKCHNSTCPKVEECESSDPYKPSHCFAVWKEDNVTGRIEVNMKGCFTHNPTCNETECIDYSYETKLNVMFCCCNENMCNTAHKWLPKNTPAPPIEVQPESINNSNYVFYEILVIVTSLCGIFCAIYLFRYRQRKHNNFHEVPLTEPEISGSSTCLTLRPIQLVEVKARGRFGTVWRAQMKPDEIAVKIFPMQDKQSWNTEQDIFKLPRMKHPNILDFIGTEKHTENLQTELWLITAYHSRGSLCDFLKANTVSWMELCKIAETMSRGLMHLHEEILESKTDGLKPAIAHRDFKSKNVLLKHDLTACIADFGLALVFQPSKHCGDTHGQVGTRRYMAPEILEGAINFTRDSFLRIDVYACGLVLWELVSRCTAGANSIGPYMLPFELELGTHPTLEEMQESVVTKKLRPAIEKSWRTHSGLNAICDTMEECWDHDAEARLSASCVMERVAQHTKYPATQLLIETNTNHVSKDPSESL